MPTSVATSDLRVAVADRSALFAEALARSLQGASLRADAAMAGSDSLSAVVADVVLLDGDRPLRDVQEDTAALRRQGRRPHIVLLVNEPYHLHSRTARLVGASGWLTRDCAFEAVVLAVRRAAAGGAIPAPRSALRADATPLGDPGRLTLRELEIVRFLAQGIRNDDIAGALGISANTVRTHVQNILRRLDVSTRLAAVATVRRAGLLEANARAPRSE